MEFYDVVKRRHSVRRFVPSQISDEALMRIVEAGRLAPSGCNLQNREFIIVRDRKTLSALHDKIQPDFANAAAAIVLVMDPGETRFGSFWIEDAAAAVENMLLAIVNEGYDSVWVEGTLLPHEDWARKLLDVPENKRVYIALPIGKAATEPKSPPKTALDHIVSFERYS